MVAAVCTTVLMKVRAVDYKQIRNGLARNTYTYQVTGKYAYVLAMFQNSYLINRINWFLCDVHNERAPTVYFICHGVEVCEGLQYLLVALRGQQDQYH